jgi:hypothetical protein
MVDQAAAPMAHLAARKSLLREGSAAKVLNLAATQSMAVMASEGRHAQEADQSSGFNSWPMLH